VSTRSSPPVLGQNLHTALLLRVQVLGQALYLFLNLPTTTKNPTCHSSISATPSTRSDTLTSRFRRLYHPISHSPHVDLDDSINQSATWALSTSHDEDLMHVIRPLTPFSPVARAPPKLYPQHTRAHLTRMQACTGTPPYFPFDPWLTDGKGRESATRDPSLHRCPPLLSETFALARVHRPVKLPHGPSHARPDDRASGAGRGSGLEVHGANLLDEGGRAERAGRGGCQVSRPNVWRLRGVSVVSCTPRHVEALEAKQGLIRRANNEE
jgi:hypothetical protein